jgi:hypothetical protein
MEDSHFYEPEKNMEQNLLAAKNRAMMFDSEPFIHTIGKIKKILNSRDISTLLLYASLTLVSTEPQLWLKHT